jgi:ethanolamine ammonia-lyase large subunit
LKKEEFVQLMGNANEFKEGDLAIGVGTLDEASRADARHSLSRVRLQDIFSCDVLEDQLSERLKSLFVSDRVSADIFHRIKNKSVGEIRETILRSTDPGTVGELGFGMTSEMIAAVAKTMTLEELGTASASLYNPLNGPGSVGSDECFGSRIQPNSPTDDPEEILYSIFEGISYGCGDVIIGVNPANDALQDLIELENLLATTVERLELPTRWSVLTDIKKQHEALTRGARIDVAFQSLAGTSRALHGMIDCDVDELARHLEPFQGLYFETGQGSEFTNRADDGIDMVTLESRTYGLARLLNKTLKKWMIVNDVAGFIGPEVFRTGQQLIRTCLEDLLMGKLHGLVMGLDVCSTYHMGIAPGELDSITRSVVQAGPAYLMGVAGKSDAMLGYLTTDFRSHPRLRNAIGKSVARPMRQRLADLGIMRADGRLTERAGDLKPVARSYGEHPDEIGRTLRRLQERGLDIGYGYENDFAPPVRIQNRLDDVFWHARTALHREILPSTMAISKEPHLLLHTSSRDRDDYIANPPTGEKIVPGQTSTLRSLYAGTPPTVQIVISDGLNADAVNENLQYVLPSLKRNLQTRGISCGREIYLRNGRVRAGYHIGEILAVRVVVHLIGERPGTGTNNLSAYITYGYTPLGQSRWETIEHAHTTALCSINRRVGVNPVEAALRIAEITELMLEYKCSGVALAPLSIRKLEEPR